MAEHKMAATIDWTEVIRSTLFTHFHHFSSLFSFTSPARSTAENSKSKKISVRISGVENHADAIFYFFIIMIFFFYPFLIDTLGRFHKTTFEKESTQAEGGTSRANRWR